MARLTERSLAGFAHEVLRAIWEGCDLDGEDVQTCALKWGLIIKVPFDPKKHRDEMGVCPWPGDDWFEEHPDIRAALEQDNG